MLREMNDLMGYAIQARDGPIGHVKDFYFDDEAWVVRYLIVETGSWLSNRQVLISPIAIGQPNRTDRELPVSITQEQVRNSPDIDTDKPVSRQHEREYFGYYGYCPYYWGGAGLWGASAYPGAMLTGVGLGGSGAEYLTAQMKPPQAIAEADQHDDPHLRSGKAVMNYHVEASDGDIGHVEGLLLDEESWAIRYLVVNTSNWWLGHKVLVAPQWTESVSWSERAVLVMMTQDQVKGSPAYDSSELLNRSQEIDLHQYYKRAGYWADEVRLGNPQFRVLGASHENPRA